MAQVLKSATRNASNKNRDTFRKPVEVLDFAGMQRGHKVLDVSTGFGYWAEFAASITGKQVDCHNALEWKEFFQYVDFEGNVQHLKREKKKYNFFWTSFNNPANGAKSKYDIIISYANYHDLYDMEVDRSRFLDSIKQALKVNTGRFLLIDHRATVGRAAADAGSNRGLHRIEEDLVREELKLAGFEVEKESDMLSKPDDNLRSQAWTQPMHDTDRFCLLLKVSDI